MYLFDNLEVNNIKSIKGIKNQNKESYIKVLNERFSYKIQN